MYSSSWGKEYRGYKEFCRRNLQKERRSLLGKSKVFAIDLPESYDDNSGYHIQCYRSFMAVPKHRKEDEAEKTGSRPTQSETTFSTKESTGVFPRVCLFCEKETKSLGKDKRREQLGSCKILDLRLLIFLYLL